LNGKRLNTIVAVLLEISTWLLLDNFKSSGWLFLAVLGVHAIACYFFSRVLINLLPVKYKNNKNNLIFFFFGICFFIPFLGAFGLYIAWHAGLYWPRKVTLDIYHITEEPPLPYKPLNISEKTIYGQAGLSGVVKNASNPDKRLKAIMATRQLDDRDAIPILRLALKDPVDDVRLLAYSMLDSKEEKINSGIQSIEKKLSNAEGVTKSRLHKEMAHYFWELSYLGLAQGDVKQHVLIQSRDNFIEALKFDDNDAGICFNLGRVLLSQDKYQESLVYFKKAMEFGISENDVIPYMAEVEFNLANYFLVVKLLSRLPEEAKRILPLSNIANFWLVK